MNLHSRDNLKVVISHAYSPETFLDRHLLTSLLSSGDLEWSDPLISVPLDLILDAVDGVSQTWSW